MYLEGSGMHQPSRSMFSWEILMFFPRDVRLPVSTLSFQSLAFILSLVHPPGDAVGGPISAWAPAVFLRRYAGPWPRLAWTRWVFFGGPWIQLHYHMRVFTAKLEHS